MSAARIAIRMYNVGFGDAFLVNVDHDGGVWRMLIDCGVHTGGGSTHKMADIVDRIIADITPDDGEPRLDVVVATHRHRDHVSGFEREAWDAVTVGEVWMPFTENSRDALGSKIRQEQSSKATRLVAHLDALAAAGDGKAAQAAHVAKNSLTNEAAMNRLHRGFAGRPKRRYFPDPHGELGTFEIDDVPGMAVHMLGPLRDRAVIAAMNPPADQRWLRAIAAAEDEAAAVDPDDAAPLFAPSFVLDPETVEARYADLYIDDADRAELAADVSFDEWGAAASVTDAVNNTSLVFVLDVDGTKLLFPGDAQWGLWDAILARPGVEELLQETRLYKVGHHGSHNANHKRYVTDMMGTGTASLMSFHPVDNWPSIPNQRLMKALTRGDRVLVRSDETKRAPHTHRDGTLVTEYVIDL